MQKRKILTKTGVDLSKLTTNTRNLLEGCLLFWQENTSSLLVVTSTYDGKHMQGSFHYLNRAFDLRLPHELGKADLIEFVFELRRYLRLNVHVGVDVVLEKTHIHVELDRIK